MITRRVLTAAIETCLLMLFGLGSPAAAAAESLTYAQACDGAANMVTATATGLRSDDGSIPSEIVFWLASAQAIVGNQTVPVNETGSATARFTDVTSGAPLQVIVRFPTAQRNEAETAFFTVIDCSPDAQITSLVTQVESLDTSGGITTSLDAKLSHVLSALASAKGNSVTVACNSLNAFINEVEARSRSRLLTSEQAASLISAASSVKKALGCT